MELGLAGLRAIVCASSQGLGKACASVLAEEGVHVVITGRTEATLEEARAEIAASGASVTAVQADVATAEGRAAILAACPNPDILINNAGGPPPGDFRAFGRDDWIRAFDANLFSAVEMIRATLDGMIERRFGRIVNITSHSVKMPKADLSLSVGIRAGLTGFVAGLAREVVRGNVTINNLLPGPFETQRMVKLNQRRAAASGRTPEAVKAEQLANHPARRWGDPREFGEACAFLCRRNGAYMTGQNLLLDGGLYPGVF